MHVTIEQAERAIEAARKRALELNTQMCIAVVDSGQSQGLLPNGRRLGRQHRHRDEKGQDSGVLRHADRSDGRLSQPGGPLFGIEHSNDGLITFPGGLPIVDADGVMIGAIGVSGSSVENDHAVAEAGGGAIGVCDLPEHPWRT